MSELSMESFKGSRYAKREGVGTKNTSIHEGYVAGKYGQRQRAFGAIGQWMEMKDWRDDRSKE